MMLALLILEAGLLNAQSATGEVVGEVIDKKGEAVWAAHVYIDDVFGQRYQARTEPDGRFRISGIPTGDYSLTVQQSSDTLFGIPVSIRPDGTSNIGAITFDGGMIQELGNVYITADKGLKLIDGDLPVTTMEAREIQQSSVKFDLEELIGSMSSDIQVTESGELVIRGSRPGDMLYLIDGVKAAEIGSMPSVAIGRLTVYTGGIPARYGDTLGGVVAMETQSYFDLYRAWESRQLKADK